MTDPSNTLPWRDGLDQNIVSRDGDITRYAFPDGTRVRLVDHGGAYNLDIIDGATVTPVGHGLTEDDATAKLLELAAA